MADEKKLHCALDLFRRLPPSQIDTNLSFVSELLDSDTSDELLQTVDTPLKIGTDTEVKKDYLLCDYNRDGDSYRSPYTNKYFPAVDDGVTPSESLRKMEMEANDIFQLYTEAYFEGGLSRYVIRYMLCSFYFSVYFWEVEGGFAACVLIKKDGTFCQQQVYLFMSR